MAVAAYDAFVRLTKEIKTLQTVAGLLGWDQETHMPPKAGAIRAAQMETLSSLVHDRLVAPQLWALVEELSGRGGELTPEQNANVREMRRTANRERKMPAELVREMARTTALAHDAWVKARRESKFELYAPSLEKIVELKRREAAAVGYEGGHVYDPLLDDFEPGMKTPEAKAVLSGLRDQLVGILKQIRNSKRAPKEHLVPPGTRFPQVQQREFGLSVVRAMGFDLEAGSLDTANHPFCSSAGPTDVRLTTRYDEEDVASCFFSIVHETGHGLYEQGFLHDHFGTPMAEAVSSGIHESQSRLWENQICRGRAFWSYQYPKLQAAFPSQLNGVTLDDFYFKINEVTPSLIRVEADELTYNLHILLRFEIECDLLTGTISVSNLPKVWNQKMDQLLGLVPPTDAQGVLQDIHWSFGGIGYFPTYTLGNLYAAQFMQAVRRDLPDLDARLGRGELLTLREWLREKIHRHGKQYRAGELVQRVTGSPLSPEPFLAYLRGKFGPLYGF